VSETSKVATLEETERDHAVKAILRQAKMLATEYYKLTGKPLGVTGEVAEYEAAEKLGLVLAPARTKCVDAYREAEGKNESFQIKGRAVLATDRYRCRLGKIVDGQFDAVLLVLLDKTTLETIEILRAERLDVIARLDAPGGIARNVRRSLAIAQFKSIAKKIWPMMTAS
jgi:hypothetical protein